MGESLFSQSWYRVAPLRPRLRSHVQIFRHRYRDRDWYVLQDKFTGRNHRLSPEAYQLIGLMNGRRTLSDIWEMVCLRLGDHMPTQDEVIDLMSRLFRSDLLQTSSLPNFVELEQRYSQIRRGKRLSSLRSPMFVRIPLIDPDRFLGKTIDWVKPLLGRAAGIIWLLVVVTSIFLAILHWPDLTNNFTDQILGLENMLLITVLYPILKIIHEFGHAYMVKKWGGEVHEMGVLLLVFMPIPYVDASSSLIFRDKYKRMLVGGAGILVEMFIASLALLVWLNVEPGVVRVAAYNIMVIAGVSTLLFNGNPLLRFDAYYVLADFLEIPNLGQKSNGYIGYLCRRYWLGSEADSPPVDSLKEAFWLFSYGIGSFFYRIFISFKIILFVAGQFFFLGVLLALWAGFGMFFLPLSKVTMFLLRDTNMRKKRLRILGVMILPLLLLLLGFVFVPVPSFTLCEGVTWVPEVAKVHIEADGFIEEIVTPSGTNVGVGVPLVRLLAPQLQMKVKMLQARRQEYLARYNVAKRVDQTDAEVLNDAVTQLELELRRAKERVAALTVRSLAKGTFVLHDETDLPGTYWPRGSIIGYLLDPSNVTIRVVVSQADIDRVRGDSRSVSIRLVEEIDREIPARLLREIPAATNELPSLALSLEGGGRFAIDPRNPNRLQVVDQLFQFELQPQQTIPYRVEERVLVRFEHSPEPLAYRLFRFSRRLLLSRFAV